MNLCSIRDVDYLVYIVLYYSFAYPFFQLYPFQRVGIEEGIRRNGRVLIADEMGLGKTIQALGIVGHFREDWPLLIVSPSSVKFNWLVELSNWLPDEVDDSKVVVLYTGKSSQEIKKSTQEQFCVTHIYKSMNESLNELFVIF